ncbi:MAG: LysR substrate-binding domain-containing protein, partial [Primorskyibacter sp.]
HSAVESRDIHVRTVCIFPKGHRLGALTDVTPADLGGEKLIHTRRESEFFKSLANAFLDANVPLMTLVETRQFTAACELVSHGVGVAVVSELDAVNYGTSKIESRPFSPAIAHKLSLVHPTLKRPSAVTSEFISAFADSLKPFQI